MRAAAVKIDHDRQWRSGSCLRRNAHEIAATDLLMSNRELMVARRERCGGNIRPRESGTGERDKEPERDRGSNH